MTFNGTPASNPAAVAQIVESDYREVCLLGQRTEPDGNPLGMETSTIPPR